MTTEQMIMKQEEKKMKVTTVNANPTLRLYKMVKKGTQQKGFCMHCGENPATHNLGTYCERCWFYMQNQFNDSIFPGDTVASTATLPNII